MLDLGIPYKIEIEWIKWLKRVRWVDWWIKVHRNIERDTRLHHKSSLQCYPEGHTAQSNLAGCISSATIDATLLNNLSHISSVYLHATLSVYVCIYIYVLSLYKLYLNCYMMHTFLWPWYAPLKTLSSLTECTNTLNPSQSLVNWIREDTGSICHCPVLPSVSHTRPPLENQQDTLTNPLPRITGNTKTARPKKNCLKYTYIHLDFPLNHPTPLNVYQGILHL